MLGTETYDWDKMAPGHVVILKPGMRLESPTSDADFSIGDRVVYSLCIGHVASTTASGLTLLKVFLLTPSGVGYKRVNLGGNKQVDVDRLRRNWT